MGFLKSVQKKLMTDPKTGKTKLKTTKVSKTKTTGSNAYSTEKARLEHERIKSNEKVQLSKIATHQANVAHMAEQAGATIRQFAKSNQGAAIASYQNNARNTSQSSAAEQATRGGLDSGATRREDDEGSAGTW